MSNSRTVHGLIRGAYHRLSEANWRLADLILNFPAGLLGYSRTELACMASTSNATVSRFVRKLGFADFEEMRRRAREVLESGTPVYLLDRSIPDWPAP
jgi:DNA-binding MurR/RpiR family transcriptional regulator